MCRSHLEHDIYSQVSFIYYIEPIIQHAIVSLIYNYGKMRIIHHVARNESIDREDDFGRAEKN